jgi:hypothetical protein
MSELQICSFQARNLFHRAVEGLRVLTSELQRNDKVSAPPIDRISGLIRDMFRLQNSHQDFLKAHLVGDPTDIIG